MSEHMTAGGAADEEEADNTDVDEAHAAKTRSVLAREPGARGSWQVIKINRCVTLTRRRADNGHSDWLQHLNWRA